LKPKPKKANPENPEPKKSMGSSKYQHLLDDPDVMRWFMNECRGSEITGREEAICERFDTTPRELGKMTPKEAKNFLLDMVTEMEQARLRANYIRNLGKAAKSWSRHKDIEVNVRIKISKKNEVEKYGKEQPTMPNELKKTLDATESLRRKAAIAIA
jgi:hypothetical protein